METRVGHWPLKFLFVIKKWKVEFLLPIHKRERLQRPASSSHSTTLQVCCTQIIRKLAMQICYNRKNICRISESVFITDITRQDNCMLSNDRVSSSRFASWLWLSLYSGPEGGAVVSRKSSLLQCR